MNTPPEDKNLEKNYEAVLSIKEGKYYFYVNELPNVDNFFLNFVSQYPSPDYIIYIQPIFIMYFLTLYLPFMIYNKFNK